MAVERFQTQINKRFGALSALFFLLFWLLGVLVIYFGVQYGANQQLIKDSDALVANLSLHEGQLELESSTLRTNYLEPASGHYYVVYAQRAERIESASLDGFVLALPRRTSAPQQVFVTDGPAQTTLLVRFAQYQLDEQWLDVAVAQAYDLTLNWIKQSVLVFSGMMLVLWLLVYGVLRVVLASRLGAIPQAAHELGLDSVQASLFASRWPLEWVALADRLHQALIQLRARMVYTEQPTDAYQLTWPHDIHKTLEPYKVTHPHLSINLQDQVGEVHFLIGRQDMDLLLSSLLDNAAQWAKSRVEVTLSHQDDKLCIRLEDDGEGMAPERLTQIQQRTKKREVAEEESGLRRVEEIVYAYQGHLLFEPSEKLGGLRVDLCFDRPNY